MRLVAIAAATAVALVVLAGVLVSIGTEASLLNSSAGWYGLAVFACFPVALGFFAWRNQR